MNRYGGLWRGYLGRNVAIINNRKISRDRCTPINRRGSERKSKQKCPRDSLLGAGCSTDDGTYGSKSEYGDERT